MKENLRNKTVNGITWSLLDNFASSGISFLVGIFLARLLSPKEYGIMAIIAIFMAISTSIVDSGFSNALIRKNDADHLDYSTTFYFNICVSICIYVGLFYTAPYISSYFSQPLLTPVTRVLGLSLIIDSFATVQKTLLIKKIDFKKQSKISLLSSIISGGVGITLALNDYGVWSLVYMQVTRQSLTLVLCWVTSNWSPGLKFSFSRFKALFAFGSKMLVSGLIETIYKNIYYFIIGKTYSSSSLGQYTRAEQFSTIFSSNLTNAIQRVSYPVLSSIQDDSTRLKAAYRRIIKSTMLITFASMMSLAAISQPLISTLIGERWSEAASYLQLICLAESLYPLHALNLNILQVKGRSSLVLKLEVVKKIVAIVPILLGLFAGIKLMLIGSIIFSICAFIINSYYSRRLIDYSTKDQILDILPSLCVSSIISLILFSIGQMAINLHLMLAFQASIGIFLYIGIYEQLKLEEYRDIKHMILRNFIRQHSTPNR